MAYGYKRKRRYTRKRFGRFRRARISVPHRRYSSSAGARARHRARVLGRGTSKPRYVEKRSYDEMTPDGVVKGRVIVRRGPRAPVGQRRGDAQAAKFWEHAKDFGTRLGKAVAEMGSAAIHKAYQHPEIVHTVKRALRAAGPTIEEIGGAAEGGLMLLGA